MRWITAHLALILRSTMTLVCIERAFTEQAKPGRRDKELRSLAKILRGFVQPPSQPYNGGGAFDAALITAFSASSLVDRALNGPSGLHALEDNLIVTLFDRLDAEARPLLDHQHALERRIVLHFFKTQHPRELFDEANVHGGPARVFLRALWIEIIARLVKLKRIGIVLAHDLAEADDARRLGVGMVKEDEIAELHFTHEVARLIVADSLPDD